MPGITGIFSRAVRFDNELDQMLDCMKHESFYRVGKYINHDLGLYVGWTVHKESFADCMPIFNESQDLVLFFAGENYSDNEALAALQIKGHAVDSILDARYLIHLYEERGDSFFKTLNGFFHGLLIDIKARKAILFNDRYGMQRIYYSQDGSDLFFSSEAKCLLKIRPHHRSISPESLGELLCFGCIVNHKTLFQGIFQLPGASLWTLYADGHINKRIYFIPAMLESAPPLNRETYYERFRHIFKKVVHRYIQTKSTIALSLTGGIDTRMLLAVLKPTPKALPCYTFSGPYRDCFDAKISRQVAQLCNQIHFTLRLDSNFLRQFPILAERVIHITDGCLDLSGIPNLYVNRLAREIAPVRITGNYGQEVFRKYIAFRPSPPLSALLDPAYLPYLNFAKRTYHEMMGGNMLSFALFKQAPWFHYARLSLEQSQLVQRSPFMDNDLVELAYQAPKDTISDNYIALRLINDEYPELANIATDRGILGDSWPPLSLAKRGYYELLFKMDYYYSHGMLQWMAHLNHCGSWLGLEKAFLGWHKYYHLRVWFRDEWSEYIRDILLSQKALQRAHLSSKGVRNLIDKHMRNEANYTRAINLALAIELIHREFIDGSP